MPDQEQLEIFYLLEEGEKLKVEAEKLKARADTLSAPALAEKYDFSEQWIRAIRKKLRKMFGTYRDGYINDWEEFRQAIESHGRSESPA